MDRFLKDKLNDEQYAKYRDTFFFMPDDPNNLQQVAFANAKTTVSADGKTAVSIREVSPGSQPPVDVPLHDLDDDPYDSKYFSKDTRRRFVNPEFPHPDIEQIKLDMQNPDDPDVQEAKKKLAKGPSSSPGNGCRFATGPSDFDPSDPIYLEFDVGAGPAFGYGLGFDFFDGEVRAHDITLGAGLGIGVGLGFCAKV